MLLKLPINKKFYGVMPPGMGTRQQDQDTTRQAEHIVFKTETKTFTSNISQSYVTACYRILSHKHTQQFEFTFTERAPYFYVWTKVSGRI
jgi:hypothetical protein